MAKPLQPSVGRLPKPTPLLGYKKFTPTKVLPKVVKVKADPKKSKPPKTKAVKAKSKSKGFPKISGGMTPADNVVNPSGFQD
jgi:hypothetical protein